MRISDKEILQAISEAIPKRVDIYYVDYRDDLEESKHLEVVNDILNLRAERYALGDAVMEDFDTHGDHLYETVRTINKDYVEPALMDLLGVDCVDNELHEFEDYIRDIICERDDSTPLADLYRNTRDLPMRIAMYSNYESMPSAWGFSQSGVAYDDYFKQIIDVLQLNPAEVKRTLSSAFKMIGPWPNKPKRNPYVSYKDFLSEILENSSGCCQLNFVGLLDLSQLENYEGIITVPAGNCCGLFDNWNGGGSMIEMELLRPITIDVKKPYGPTSHDVFRAYLDEHRGYSMNSVYGPTRKFWGDTVTFSNRVVRTPRKTDYAAQNIQP